MTDKEKARAYDDALEIAKNEINIKGIGETVELCERLFPELRESEDERIRKWLLECFENLSDGNFVEISREDILAYLKRQKEQKPVEIHIDNPNIQKVDPNVKISTSDSSASGDELLYVSNKSYRLGYQDGKREAEQKPAEWSEEDKDYYDTIVRKLEVIGDDCGLSNNQIKFLREHCPSYRSEWSDEDERMLSRCIKSVECSKQFADSESYKAAKDVEMNWLKSIRPSWKPSEGQMSMLLAVINDPNNAGAESCQMALKSLYEQLKKLK